VLCSAVVPQNKLRQPNAIQEEAVNLGGIVVLYLPRIRDPLDYHTPKQPVSRASHVHNQCTQALHKRRSGEQNPVMFKCHQGWPQLSAITNPVSSGMERGTGESHDSHFLALLLTQGDVFLRLHFVPVPDVHGSHLLASISPLSLVLSACGLRLQLHLELELELE